MEDKEEKIIKTACASHCGGACLLKVHTKNGVITRIDTDDGEEPQLRACLRCRAYRQRVYDPDRLKYPMKRIGERGEAMFERISWDEALDRIVEEINRVRNTFGPSALHYLAGGGDKMFLNSPGTMANILAMTGGFTGRWGMHSFEGGLFASIATYGTLASRNNIDDLLNSRLIIMWGWDPTETIQETNTSWFLLRAKESGAKIVSIDPRHTNSTALMARQWIPIRPGTDTAVLISMAYVIISENLLDQSFLDRYTVGFDLFRDYVIGKEDGTPKTPAWAEEISGIPANIIINLAREYATTKPAALVSGIAPGRTAYGEQFHRASKTLAAMTGNIGVHGGWAGRSFVTTMFGGYNYKLGGLPRGKNPVEAGVPPRRDGLPTLPGTENSSRIHASELADAILKGKAGGYPADIKMALVMTTNPVNQFPNTNKIIKAFKKLEFIAVAEQVMTATARFADILLPVSTYMERNDIVAEGGIPYYGHVNKVIEPLHESRSLFEIYRGIATRLGVTVYNEKTEDEWLKVMVEGSHVPDYDEFKRNAIYRIEFPEPHVAFKKQIEDPDNNPFPTPSGKIEIYSQRLADMNLQELPPIPKYIEHWEGRNDPLAEKYPLQLITTHFKRRAHTQFEKVPWLRELLPQAITMNTVDAQARDINNGDMVKVFNDRGEIILPAEVTERIMPGVVNIPQGAWHAPDEKGVDRGGCSNVLTLDKRSPGGAVCHNTGLVQVEREGEQAEKGDPDIPETYEMKVTESKANQAAENTPSGQQGFFFNQSRCIGCYTCMVACKDRHDIPAGPANWIRVACIEKGKYPEISASYLALPCLHCADGRCIRVCPVKAIIKRETDGIVIVDREACIGGEECNFACLKACPYDAPQFGSDPNPKMQKCDFCLDELVEGKKPVCVNACPTRAMDAGPLEDLREEYGITREAEGFTYNKKVEPSIIFKPKE